MAPYTRLSLVECIALMVLSLLAAGDSITYCTPGAFLGQALTAQGAATSQVMLAYGLFGVTTATTCVLVLLCQSIPAVAGLTPASKWSIVVVAQSVSVASSVLVLVWPVTPAVMAARALHGTAAAGYLVYCLSLLVELSPKQHLATGIAAMAAGITAGDSVAPVVGVIIYDRAGLRAAFLLPAAFGILVLLMAVAMFPIWQWSHRGSKDLEGQRSHNRSGSGSSRLPRLPEKMSACDSWQADAALRLSDRYPSQHTATDQIPLPRTNIGLVSKENSNSAAQPKASALGHSGHGAFSKDPLGHDKASVIQLVPTGSSQRTQPLQVAQTAGTGARLDFKSVADTVKDPVVFCQCVILFLEQVVRATITVVLPATMGTTMWLVGVVYIANVNGAVISPFVIDCVIRKAPKVSTHLLATILSITMALSSILSVAFSRNIGLLCPLLFVYGASQSSVGTLVYIHVARRQDFIGHHTGLHVSMCMYVFADFAAGGLGNLTGGALQHQVWGIQLGVVTFGAALATSFGVTVGLTSYMHERQQKGGQTSQDSQIIIEDATSEPMVGHLSQVIIEQSVGHF